MAWSVPKIGALATPVASGNLTLAEPAGIAQGDLMVACIAFRSNVAFGLPNGWALVATQQSSGDTDATNGIASGLMCYIVRGASPPALTWTRTGGDMATGRIIAYTGAKPAPYDTGSANTLAVASATVTTATITTAEANELIVAMTSAGDNLTASAFDAATDPTTASGATDTTNAPTAGTWRERADDGTGTGADGALAIADAIRATNGATGTIQATISASARHVMIAGAFKMAAVTAQAIAATEVGVATLSKISTFIRTIAPVELVVITINKLTSHFRTIAPVEITVVTVTKSLFKTISATSINIASVTLALVFNFIINAVSISIATVTNKLILNLLINTVSTSVALINKIATYLVNIAATGIDVASINNVFIPGGGSGGFGSGTTLADGGFRVGPFGRR